MNLSNNLFKYATSELSQDAFICWLISHLYPENRGADIAMEDCATEFIGCFIPGFNGDCTSFRIERQHNKIDVLISIDDKRIIIEDKTFTDSHDDQINVYKNKLINEGESEDSIICVFYKIIEQPYPEKNVDYEFTREILLKLFGKYREMTNNRIFTDYYDYLLYIDKEVKSFTDKDIKTWNWYSYVGFFNMLQETLFKQKNSFWQYVNNPAGGFNCLWWSKSGWGEALKKSSLYQRGIQEIYPQFEDNTIAIKITANNSSGEISSLRWELFEYFRDLIPEFKKKRFRPGRHMTVGYVEYKYENYEETVSLIETSIDKSIEDL